MTSMSFTCRFTSGTSLDDCACFRAIISTVYAPPSQFGMKGSCITSLTTLRMSTARLSPPRSRLGNMADAARELIDLPTLTGCSRSRSYTRRCQSGKNGDTGLISRCGNRQWRHTLFEVAAIIIVIMVASLRQSDFVWWPDRDCRRTAVCHPEWKWPRLGSRLGGIKSRDNPYHSSAARKPYISRITYHYKIPATQAFQYLWTSSYRLVSKPERRHSLGIELDKLDHTGSTLSGHEGTGNLPTMRAPSSRTAPIPSLPELVPASACVHL